LTLGAGDIWKSAFELAAMLEAPVEAGIPLP